MPLSDISFSDIASFKLYGSLSTSVFLFSEVLSSFFKSLISTELNSSALIIFEPFSKSILVLKSDNSTPVISISVLMVASSSDSLADFSPTSSVSEVLRRYESGDLLIPSSSFQSFLISSSSFLSLPSMTL